MVPLCSKCPVVTSSFIREVPTVDGHWLSFCACLVLMALTCSKPSRPPQLTSPASPPHLTQTHKHIPPTLQLLHLFQLAGVLCGAPGSIKGAPSCWHTFGTSCTTRDLVCVCDNTHTTDTLSPILTDSHLHKLASAVSLCAVAWRVCLRLCSPWISLGIGAGGVGGGVSTAAAAAPVLQSAPHADKSLRQGMRRPRQSGQAAMSSLYPRKFIKETHKATCDFWELVAPVGVRTTSTVVACSCQRTNWECCTLAWIWAGGIV